MQQRLGVEAARQLQDAAGEALELCQGFDPGTDGVALAFLLAAYGKHLGAAAPPADEGARTAFLNAAAQVVAGIPREQVKLAPKPFAALCRALKEQVLAEAGGPSFSAAVAALKSLMTAIEKVRQGPEHLTPQHVDFVQLCLLAKLYHVAAPVLDEDIYDVNPKHTGLDVTDFLLYCYYGGMVYLGQKRLGRAIAFFMNAMTAPSTAASEITAACYKKYVLAALMARGEVPPLPKYASHAVARQVKKVKEYGDVADAFRKGSVAALEKAIAKHEAVFTADNNLGLVKQCVEALYRKRIAKLTKTYLTLSLEDIAKEVGLGGPAEAEAYLLRMIEAGEIASVISQEDGMVAFTEEVSQYGSPAALDALESSIAEVSKLGLKAQALDNDLACNRGYLAKSMRSGGLVDPLAAEERSNLFLDSTGLDSLPGVEGL